MRIKSSLRCGAIAAILSVAPPAHAADWFQLLDWACAPTATNKAAVKAMVLKACDATEGAKAACDIVSGTPFACFTSKAAARNSRSCDKAKLTFEISATTSQTLGWKVQGTLSVAAEYYLYWNTAQECQLTATTPVPTAQGGDYIFRAGEAKAVAIMLASGEGKVTFLGGTVFSESLNKKCAGELSVTAYKAATASACSGTPSPSPSPSASPTPSPTASATPPPPTPTASATPWPTPVATVVPVT